MYALTKSSRWCPTPEQVMLLEEMYRGGIRTPKAAQIQAITSHLSHYGKIENKNVFYWFQNHKARDRQKLRKKLMMSKQIHLHHQHLKYQNELSPQLFYYFPFAVVPPGGVINGSPQSTSSQKVDPQTPDHQSLEVDKAVAKTINQDWLMVIDEVPTKNGPLETLELFPTTPTGLNNGCDITSTPSLSFSDSTR